MFLGGAQSRTPPRGDLQAAPRPTRGARAPRARPLRKASALYAHLDALLASGERRYVLLDEIQFVEDWPEVVNSIKTKHRNASLFVTGSNSALLDEDKDGVLGGRTLSFRIMPFTFREVLAYRREREGAAAPSPEDAFGDYLVWGGFPLVFSQPDAEQREFGNYAAVDDNWPKLVVSRDTVPLSRDGIRHVNIIDFLLADNIEFPATT